MADGVVAQRRIEVHRKRHVGVGVDDQHHACFLGLVLDPMLARVVEHQRHAFLPMEMVAADFDPALLRLLGHDQRIVEADDARRRSAVRHELGTAGQDAEQGAVHTRNPADRRIGVGHRSGVGLDLVAPDLEHESTPGSAGHEQVARVHLGQGRNFFVVAEQVLQVSLDLVVDLAQLPEHREGLERIVACYRHLGHVAQDHIRHLEIEVFDRLLWHPDVLCQVEAAALAGLCVIDLHDDSTT